jgi:hypothetical protein
MTTAIGIEMAIGIGPEKEGRDLERDPTGALHAIETMVTQAEKKPLLSAGSQLEASTSM